VFPLLIIPRLPGVALLLRVAWSEFRIPAKNAKFTVPKSFPLSYDLEPPLTLQTAVRRPVNRSTINTIIATTSNK